MNDQAKPKMSKATIVGLAVALLLGIALVANLKTILAVARGERTIADVASGHVPQSSKEYEPFVPDDIGSLQAKVTVEVFFDSEGQCECNVEAAYLGQALGEIDPARIRVVFQDLMRPEACERLKEVNDLRSHLGFVVNGKDRLKVPDPDAPGKERLVDLMGDYTWVLADVHAALDQELKAKYEGKGLGFGAKEFREQIVVDMTRLRGPEAD